jgi:hypothetical protein
MDFAPTIQELQGARLPERVARSSFPASENLHTSSHPTNENPGASGRGFVSITSDTITLSPQPSASASTSRADQHPQASAPEVLHQRWVQEPAIQAIPARSV